MPDLLAAALALPGLWVLMVAIVVAGLVRGFTGFGSAMIIMPAAASVLDPFAALAFLTTVEFWGPLPNLPAALRTGQRRDAGRLLLGAAVGLPLGLLALSRMPPEVFGGVVSVVVLILLACVVRGWRYTGVLPGAGVVGVGALGGVMGGAAGVPGPPVIMLYMASQLPVAVIRANFLLYLLGIDLLLIAIFVGTDVLDPLAITAGLVAAPVYMLANLAGAALFRDGAERFFRGVAYVSIAVSALLGLPFWG